MFKNLLLLTVLVTAQAHALEIHYIQKANSKLKVMTKETVDKIWHGNTPACIKNSSKTVGYNKNFIDRKYPTEACASSDAQQRLNSIRGAQVTVLKLAELPDEILKQVLK